MFFMKNNKELFRQDGDNSPLQIWTVTGWKKAPSEEQNSVMFIGQREAAIVLTDLVVSKGGRAITVTEAHLLLTQ